jgi:NitT/TauT family transport system substrate-binding protein
VFLLADEGYPAYACMVLAPTRTIETAPETVRAFVEASAEGWRDYLQGDPAPADALIRRDNPEMSPALLKQAREKLVSYGVVLGGDAQASGPGVMTDARWEAFHRVTSDQGVYPKTLDWRSAYTLEFAGSR